MSSINSTFYTLSIDDEPVAVTMGPPEAARAAFGDPAFLADLADCVDVDGWPVLFDPALQDMTIQPSTPDEVAYYDDAVDFARSTGEIDENLIAYIGLFEAEEHTGRVELPF